jgi:hypothetical protein
LNITLVASLALALLLAVAALIREVRLRRALQALLRRLLVRRRFYSHEKTQSDRTVDSDDRPAGRL